MDAPFNGFDRETLRSILQEAANTTSDYVTAATAYQDPSPDRIKMVQGILWSRRYIWTYNAVLLGVLMCFTLWHWAEHLLRARRRRSRARQKGLLRVDNSNQDIHDTGDDPKRSYGINEVEQDSTASSSSNSDSGRSTPPDTKRHDSVNEETPLLLDSKKRDHSTNRSTALGTIQSWLMHQPANIPIINKVLPSNLTSIMVLLFFGLNAFYLFYRVPMRIGLIYVFADRAGLMFVANLPVLYLFAAKNQPIKRLTGYSYEALNIFHRRVGELTCLYALFHTAGMLTVWYTLVRPLGETFWALLHKHIIWTGFLAFFTYEILYLSSVGSFRQRFYELFLATHVILQTAALCLLYFHHWSTRPYIGTALLIFLLDRLIFRLTLKTRTLRADLSVLPDGNTVLVSANWQIPPRGNFLHRLFRRDIAHGWKPSEHVFVSIPAMAPKHAFQAHPFTIASAAPKPGSEHAWLNLVIRAHDGFSADLLRYARTHASVDVRTDGPYGSMHALHMLREADVAVLVAGGSGIAVTFPLIWSLLCDAEEDVEMGEGSRLRRHVCLIWVVHEEEHVQWIGQERLDELRERGLRVVMPTPTKRAGRPDMTRLVEEAVLEGGGVVGRSVLVVSGPDGMNRDVRNACAGMVGRGLDVGVSVEKFGW